jgi:hypothetical protein
MASLKFSKLTKFHEEKIAVRPIQAFPPGH